MPRIEVAGDICLRRPRPTQGCRANDDDDDGGGGDDDDDNDNDNDDDDDDDENKRKLDSRQSIQSQF
jgi:hypothetical protein